jgi:DNA-directed RNA polymerase specialized sigma24 family protein
MPDQSFFDLLAGVRRGDAKAAEELFRRYEAQVRLEVRLRLRDPRLRRLIDEADVCQSVMLSFFVHARLGQYDLAHPEELLRLLLGMARNKMAAQARRLSAQRRDFRRDETLAETETLVAPEASPSQMVTGEELLLAVRARLSEEERLIADLRVSGQSWTEIAVELGGSADGRRMQLQRAADRIGRDLGLEDHESA